MKALIEKEVLERASYAPEELAGIVEAGAPWVLVSSGEEEWRDACWLYASRSTGAFLWTECPIDPGKVQGGAP